LTNQPFEFYIPILKSQGGLMHHITKVSVEGFWETYDFEFDVNRDTTFFIGQNGSGKTTLINLVAAALTADLRTLAKIPFKRIVIAFGPSKNKISPYVSIQKIQRKNRPFESIEYRLLNSSAGSKEVKYTLDEAEEDFFYRRMVRPDDFPVEYYRRMQRGLVPELKSLFSVNWLSVNRINTLSAAGEKQFESSVDRKLDALSNELVRYFSTLSKRKDDEVRLFQESIFVSLLEGTESHTPFDIRLLSNLEEYKNTLENIFKELHVSSNSSDTIIDSFISRANNLTNSKYVQTGEGLLDDAIFASGFRKIESIVRRWDGLQDKLSEIFSQKDKFLTIINEMLQKKQMEVTEANELQFMSRSGKKLTPHMLSSGEKQLLILLSETLLQREQPTIFIADEPELSLHVLWQERLVASLNALNPRAQLIVATHSPDIVGPLETKAIDMETLIQ
jgi:predicted ATPase